MRRRGFAHARCGADMECTATVRGGMCRTSQGRWWQGGASWAAAHCDTLAAPLAASVFSLWLALAMFAAPRLSAAADTKPVAQPVATQSTPKPAAAKPAAKADKAAKAASAEGVDPDLKFRKGSVTGRLAAKTKRSISVEYEETEDTATDMLLPYDAKTKFVRVQNASELQRGATVEVKYEQSYKEDETGRAVLLGTVAKEIALIRDAQENSPGTTVGGSR